ncbi:MAG: wax ester/triacylglycerol synthase domain-containing protein, partial [Ilumatobacteraceae bacterium]
MSRITYDESMSSSDALIWHIEQDPLLRSTVMSVWFLERPPEPDRMRATMERMVAQLPRLRQRVVDARPRPAWVETERVDIARHYQYTHLDGTATSDDVLAIAQAWVREPFDRSRPLWQLGIFSGLADGRGALVLKVHHAIADGVGLMLMLAALADLEPNPRNRLSAADVVTPPAPVVKVRQPVTTLVRHPLATARAAARSAVSIARLVMPTRKPMSPLMTSRSSDLCLDTRTVPFATLHHAGKQSEASLNDAFISLVLDALDRYHK